MLPKSFNEESNSNEKAEKKKLAKKPFVFTNPVGNESKFEDRNKVKEYLYEIGSSEEKRAVFLCYTKIHQYMLMQQTAIR